MKHKTKNMGPANKKRYQLFLWKSTKWFPQKNTVACLKKQHSKTLYFNKKGTTTKLNFLSFVWKIGTLKNWTWFWKIGLLVQMLLK